MSLRAIALDAATGREMVNAEVFRLRIGPSPNAKNNRASPSAVVEGDRVYVHFGSEGTAALTTAGEIVWKNAVRVRVAARRRRLADRPRRSVDLQL